jgi:hypothetical protein
MHMYPRRQTAANIASSQVRLGYEAGRLQSVRLRFLGLFKNSGGDLLCFDDALVI